MPTPPAKCSYSYLTVTKRRKKLSKPGGFKQVSDPGALDSLIEKVLSAQPAAVADFGSGQGKALGFLIGQVMQASMEKVIRK